jgi:nucleotidyltransferase AbiEii toxin of type IV toxin-antitoxin system
MAKCFDPRTDILPAAQREIWKELAPAPRLSFVLYGGTAVVLYRGHRVSRDFDFFRAEPLNQAEIRAAFPFLGQALVLQETADTFVVSVDMPSGPVKVSYFGGIGFGRVDDPVQTADGTLLVASRADLLATKLKTILDRAEARDYQDIAALLRMGQRLDAGLAAFQAMFGRNPALVLRAIGFFQDVPQVGDADREVLVAARDAVRELPRIELLTGSLAIPIGPCEAIVRPSR